MSDKHRIEMDTELGLAEATRDPDLGIWTICTPYGGFRFYGDRNQVKREMTRYVQDTEAQDQE